MRAEGKQRRRSWLIGKNVGFGLLSPGDRGQKTVVACTPSMWAVEKGSPTGRCVVPRSFSLLYRCLRFPLRRYSRKRHCAKRRSHGNASKVRTLFLGLVRVAERKEGRELLAVIAGAIPPSSHLNLLHVLLASVGRGVDITLVSALNLWPRVTHRGMPYCLYSPALAPIPLCHPAERPPPAPLLPPDITELVAARARDALAPLRDSLMALIAQHGQAALAATAPRSARRG